MLGYAIRLAAVAALLAGLLPAAADAVELKVLSATAMQAALAELAATFEKSSGHKLIVAYDTPEKVAEKVTGDDAIDVAILPKAPFDKLVRAAKMVGGTTTQLARENPDVTYFAGTPWTCEQPIAAKAFLDFLGGASAKAVYKAKGMATD